MRNLIRQLVPLCAPIADVMLAPLSMAAALLLRFVRRIGIRRLPMSRAGLRAVGVYPLVDHYYEPLFHPRHLRIALSEQRALPAIHWDEAGQRELLARLRYGDELKAIPLEGEPGEGFYYNNGHFGPGDAECYYSLIRQFRPRRIVEIGAGYSTQIAQWGVAVNRQRDAGYLCEHTCIEPFEMPWLEAMDGVRVLRERVETVDRRVFSTLARGDILFIDSSHMIRPQGDVLFEYLELLPALAPGVLVHVHDIFTPRDYPARWLVDEVKFWNEQYLLEAFLSFNSAFRIIAGLAFLQARCPAELHAAFPVLAAQPAAEPGSFWMARN
ncbi:MAG: class I SAM-dependent methyltransferase [Burkholderiales bacterium]